MARSIPSRLSRNHICAWCSFSACFRSVTSTTVATNSSSSPRRGEDGMHDRTQVFQRALRQERPVIPLRLFAACLDSLFLERFCPARTILRVNALAELFERGDSLFWVEAVQAGVFIGGVGYLSGGAVQGSSACMRQPLRLGQVGLAFAATRPSARPPSFQVRPGPCEAPLRPSSRSWMRHAL